MARNISVVFTDDLDGSEGANTARFGLDGVAYEMDLAQENRAKLEGYLVSRVESCFTV